MAKTTKYYRPEWTCGRYNAEKHSAIYYNLIEGLSYFFEDDSADVIGAILKSPRNGEIHIEEIGETTNTNLESLEPFFQQLSQVNLITTEIPNSEGILNYRHSLVQWKRSNPNLLDRTTAEKLPVEQTTAEMAFVNRTGGIMSVMFELTYNCSEKCIHCYNMGATRNDEEESHRNDTNKLTLDEYKKIIDRLYDNGLVKVILSGGDPFSNHLIWDIIDYLYNKDIVFDIYTNGLALKSDLDIQRLINYYPRVVGISIYSSDAKVHDYITRVPGSWIKTMQTSRKLADFAIPLNIKCCIMQPNLKTYRGVANIARELGAVPQFEVSVTDSVDGDKCVSQFLRLTKEQMEVVLRDDNIPLYVGKEAPNFGGQPRNLDENACGAGINNFCISPSGELMPCCSFHLEFGNLISSSLDEILESPIYKQWENSTLKDYHECGKHDYCGYCNLCPGLSYSEHGDWLKSSENCCFVAQTRYDLAQRMMKGYDPLDNKTIEEKIDILEDYKNQKLKRIKI